MKINFLRMYLFCRFHSPTHNKEFQSPSSTPDKSTTANVCVCTSFYTIDAVNVDLSFFFFFEGYNVQNDVSLTNEEHVGGTPRGRRQIRRLLEVDQLAQETRRRLAEREKQRLEIEDIFFFCQ